MPDVLNTLPTLVERVGGVDTITNPGGGGGTKTSTSTDSRRGGRPGAPVNVVVDATTTHDNMMGRGPGKKTVDPAPVNRT